MKKIITVTIKLFALAAAVCTLAAGVLSASHSEVYMAQADSGNDEIAVCFDEGEWFIS